MKKNLLGAAALAFGFIFNLTEANAQVSIAPRVGVNLSTIGYTDGDDDLVDFLNEDKTNTTGILFGFAANFQVNEMFSVQPEILFSQKGYKLENEGDWVKEKLNYLEVPLLARLSFGDEALKFFVNAGPYAAYLF